MTRSRLPQASEAAPKRTDAAVTGWTSDELDRIGAADELEVTPLGSRSPVTIWVVRDGDDLYVRSWRGRSGNWFRAAQRQGEGRISASGVDKDVVFVGADDDVNNAVDGSPVTWGEHVADREYTR
jgi:hypothetical protein